MVPIKLSKGNSPGLPRLDLFVTSLMIPPKRDPSLSCFNLFSFTLESLGKYLCDLFVAEEFKMCCKMSENEINEIKLS